MRVLRDLLVVHLDVPGDALDRRGHLGLLEPHAGLADDVAPPVPDKDLRGYARALLGLVGHVHQGAGDPVGELVRVARVHFLEHASYSPSAATESTALLRIRGFLYPSLLALM